MRRNVAKTLAGGGKDFYDEFRIVRQDGEVRWLAASGRVYRDANGRPVRMAGVNYDITDRKQAEQDLRKSEYRYRSFIELTGQLAWTADADGNVVEDIPSWQKFTGQREEQVKGWGWTEAIHPEDLDRVLNEIKKSISKKSRYEVEYRLRRYDGQYRHFMARALPLCERNGKVLEWIGVNIDITDRRQMEDDLRDSRDKLRLRVRQRTAQLEKRADQLARLTSELTLAEQRERRRLAEVLHDHLQQFLVAAKMNCESMSRDAGFEHRQTAENTMHILTRAIEASRSLTTELSPPFLQQGRLSAALNWLVRWMHANHDLSIELQGAENIETDQVDLCIILFQSLRELLFNVVKHAKIKSARLELAWDGDDRLCATVTDQGCGFDPTTIWKQAQSGAGFGLFSVRERLKLIGGNLKLESIPGDGAAISLDLPLKKPGQKATPAPDAKGGARIHPPRPSGQKLRVLLVDDHAVFREGLVTMLNQQADLEVVGEASDGKEAVALARKIKPDIVLMDINLPGIDGMEATRQIRSQLSHVRIIGLSMHEEQDHAAEMIRAGASAYRSKSDSMGVILAAIRGQAK